MELINELSTMINDKDGGIFVFGYYLPKDEYIVNRIIDDVLEKVTKPVCNDVSKRIKYPNSTNRKINFETSSSNSIMVLGVDDIVDPKLREHLIRQYPIIAEKDEDTLSRVYSNFSSKSFNEFRILMNKRKNSIIIKAQLYKSGGSKPTFNIKNGSSFIFSSTYYCSICDGRFVVSKNRYGRSNKDYTSDITPYIRETKLDILLD
jgi:hypothetical protein